MAGDPGLAARPRTKTVHQAAACAGFSKRRLMVSPRPRGLDGADVGRQVGA